jgi:hypothetical protein
MNMHGWVGEDCGICTPQGYGDPATYLYQDLSARVSHVTVFACEKGFTPLSLHPGCGLLRPCSAGSS